MKKTFLKTLVAGVAMAVTVMATSVCAMAATTVLMDGSSNPAVFATGVTTAPAESGDTKSTADGTTYVRRIKLAKTSAAYIQFTATGNFQLDVMGRAGGTGARNWVVADVTGGTETVLLTQAANVTDKTFIYPATLSVTAAEAGERTYKLYTSNEVSVYYLALTDAAAAYPAFNGATAETVGYRPGTTISSSFDAASFDDIDASLDANVTVGDYTLVAGGKSLSVERLVSTDTGEASPKTIDGKTFIKRIKTNGSGSATQRAIQFDLTAPSVVKLYAASGNSQETRTAVLYKDGVQVDSVDVLEDGVYTLSASGAGSYALTGGANISVFGFDVYPAVETVLPVVTLTNSSAEGTLSLEASLNGDFEYTVTGLGFVLANPGDATATIESVTNYKGDPTQGYQFIGTLSDKTLKAQAYVEYTDDQGNTVTVYSNTVTAEAATVA